MDPENRVIPVEKNSPAAALAGVFWYAGSVARAKAWHRWYFVAVCQSVLTLSLLPDRPCAP